MRFKYQKPLSPAHVYKPNGTGHRNIEKNFKSMFTDQTNISECTEFYRLVFVQRGRGPYANDGTGLEFTLSVGENSCSLSHNKIIVKSYPSTRINSRLVGGTVEELSPQSTQLSKWVPVVRTREGDCSPGSSRLYRLGVSQAHKSKESGDERPRLRAQFYFFLFLLPKWKCWVRPSTTLPLACMGRLRKLVASVGGWECHPGFSDL